MGTARFNTEDRVWYVDYSAGPGSMVRSSPVRLVTHSGPDDVYYTLNDGTVLDEHRALTCELDAEIAATEHLLDLDSHHDENVLKLQQLYAAREEDMAAGKRRFHARACVLRDMDTAVRRINDEENGIFMAWISEYVPDEADTDEIEDFLESGALDYDACCRFFAAHAAGLLARGEYDSSGYCAEFYSSEDDSEISQEDGHDAQQ